MGGESAAKKALRLASHWRDSAGSLLLLAAATETQLLEQLVAALPTADGPQRLAQSRAASRRRLVSTLLFLGVVGLSRPWVLRSYSGDGLALLSGRPRAYGYEHPERFLAQVAQAGGDQAWLITVAQWSQQLWAASQESVY